MDTNQATKQPRLDEVDEVDDVEPHAQVTERPRVGPQPPPHIKLITDGLDGYGVYQLAAPEDQQEANVDIVFFHGLQLDTEANKDAWWTTWLTRDKTCVWPQTWLPDDLSSKYGIKARVLSVCYKANAITHKESAETIMPTLARGLFQCLVHDNVDAGGSSSGAQRRVVLVGHSLGGLVIKQLVVEAATNTITATYGVAAERFMASLSGIAFYATPHHGSHLDVVKRTFMSSQPQASHWVTDWLPIFSNHTQHLNTTFDEVCKSKQLNTSMCVVETQHTKQVSGASKLVVPTASAKLDGSFQYEVAADHDDVCRPPTSIDAIYVHFTSYVNRVAQLKVTLMAIDSIVPVKDWERSVADGLCQTGAVCIHGMGGSGKSTLSRVIHNKFCNDNKFNGRVCFLEMGKTPNIAKLQVKLLKSLNKGRDDKSWKEITNEQRRTEISTAVQTAGHFLLVIDDVWQRADLENLLPDGMRSIGGSQPHSCFGANKSWLLVTTRNKTEVQGALTGFDKKSWLQQPKPDEKLQRTMLCNWASVSTDGLSTKERGLVHELLKYCHGLPLHLRVLGSRLKDVALDDWPVQLEALKDLQATGVLHKDENHIHDNTVLRASLEDLAPHLRLLFLDFAVFFPSDTGLQLQKIDKRPSWLAWCRAAIQQYDNLQRDDTAYALIRQHVNQLVDRALLTWSGKDDDPVTVHDALRDYAVEYLQPEECRGSSTHLLAAAAGNVSVPEKGILEYVAKANSCESWSPCGSGLRLLRLEDCRYAELRLDRAQQLCLIWVQGCHDLQRLNIQGTSHLRLLRIRDCPKLSQLPSSLKNCTALTELNLGGSASLGLPDFVTSLTGLKRLGIDGSNSLTSLPASISSLTGLQTLGLQHCTNLKSLPVALGSLQSLQIMSFTGCCQLISLPASVSSLIGLQILYLGGCTSLRCLPDGLGRLKSLHKLGLNDCSQLSSLPASVSSLTELEELDLSGCSSLESLPDELDQLQSLRELSLNGCGRLAVLPTSTGRLTGLRQLQLKGCTSLLSLPDTLSHLQSLRVLILSECSQLKRLPASFGNLTALERLWLDDCTSLESLPDGLCQLRSLEVLSLHDCGQLQSLPTCIGNLTALLQLWPVRCTGLQTLPASIGTLTALHFLCLEGCTSLTCLPEEVSQLQSLRALSLQDCSELNIDMLPFGSVAALTALWLSGCTQLTALPSSFSCLTDLQYLELDRCMNLKSLPDNLGHHQPLQVLFLDDCSQLRSLPGSIGLLTDLTQLRLKQCISCSPTLNEFSGLQSLQALRLSGWTQLTSLPPLKSLTALRELYLDGCANLTELWDELPQPMALQILCLDECSQLKTLPPFTDNLASLEMLSLNRCGQLTALPPSIGCLTALQLLELIACTQLQFLPEETGQLKSLQEMKLAHCSQLKSLPKSLYSLAELGQLKNIDVGGCTSLKLPWRTKAYLHWRRMSTTLQSWPELKFMYDLVLNILVIRATIKFFRRRRRIPEAM